MDDETKDHLKMLTELAIIEVTAEFSGGGDSGCVEQAEITEALHDLKSYENVMTLQWHADKHNDGVQEPIAKFLNALVEELVMSCDMDWYNNDGGFGSILIRPGENRIFVDMNINETVSENFPIELGEPEEEAAEEVDG